MIKLRRKETKEEGIAMIEFCLVAPVFFAIALGGLEFAMAISRYQEITSLSRELARTAHRQCLLGAKAQEGRFDPVVCSHRVQSSFHGQLQSLVPGIRSVLTYCAISSSGGASVTCHKVPISSKSRFKTEDFTKESNLKNALSYYRALIIAEIEAPSNPFFNAAGGSLFGFAPGSLYATTII
jgi:hypothetical protein